MGIQRIVTTTVLLLALITISITTATAISCDCGDICVNETGWWRVGGAFNASTTPIQVAVDNATAGETICVKAGSYTEYVIIRTPHLTLRGEGAGVVIVNAVSSSDHAFEVTANYVNISGFNATGTMDFPHAGIYLSGVDHCNISENTASNNSHGIGLDNSSNNMLTNNTASNNSHGIYLYSSSNYNTLTSNTVSNNSHGIYLYSSSNYNTLTDNTASNNSHGIYLYSSSNYNTLTSNTASNNYYGIGLSHSSNYNTLTSNTASSNDYEGIYLYFSSNNTLTGNNCSNNSVGIDLYSSSNNTLTSNTASNNNNRGIDLYSSSNNTLTSNTASNNSYGIDLRYSSDYNTLTSNTASSNDYDGIHVYSSSSNTLTNNTVNSNYNRGIYLSSSSDNLIYNNYFNNTNNAYDDTGSNIWNATKTNGMNIINGFFLGGNYWSDYAGVDNDSDGLGDTLTPYNSSDDIENGGDYHPLVQAAAPDLTYIPPDPVNLAHTLGNYWVNYTWLPGTGNITDSYNVNLNGVWNNATTSTFANISVGLEGWANITVFAYNVSGTGTQSVGCVSNNMQAPAAPICNCIGGDICVNETGWWRDGGALKASTTPIQAAVDNATAGETIFVWNGSYTENVNITTAHLTLAGVGAAAVTVTAANPGDHVFNVTADYVNISGFTVTGATGWGDHAGIYLGSVDHCTISSNNVLINCEGIYLYHSSNNTIIHNNASSSIDCGSGILLRSSHSNYIINNNASNNEYPGIYLCASGSNTIADNTLINNTACNYSYGGIELYFSSSSNTITNNTIIDNLGNGIRIWGYSNSNTITNNNASSNNYDGIRLYYSSNNTLTSNTASNNDYGIRLLDSNNNMLESNNCSNNNYGIYLSTSSSNLIYNNYFNNTENAYDKGYNQWNITKTIGTNIIGGPFLGGNYWSDYAGVDNDSDGLGDTLTPYNSSDDIESVGDYHPLVMLDNTPPPSITYLQNITHAQTYINWIWTDPVDSDFSKVIVYLDGVFQEKVTIGVQCYNATLLTPGTAYEIGTLTVDTTGNINHTWVNHTATTASTTDTTPPVISNVENTDSTTDSVTISWDTNEDSDSVVKYGTTSGYYLNEQSDTTLVSSHSISLSGLSATTTYYYMVYSTDASGNTGEGSEYNFTTAVISENTTILIGDAIAAPNGYAFTSIMVNNVTDLGSGSITVTYNSSVVHVTNVTSGDGNALVVQDWNVDNSTGSVQIFAQDADESHNGDVVFANVTFHAVGEYPDSTPLAISSSELIDYTSYGIIGHSVTNGTFTIIGKPPVIIDAIATSDVIVNDNGRPRVPGTNVTVLNATVLNGGYGVTKITINLSSIGGSDNQVMERIAGTDIWTVATNATDGINLTHELVVTATDRADNTDTSVIELTVLVRGDVVRDGNLNSADVLYIAKYLVGKESMPSLLVGDISPAEGDGVITSADALYLAKYLVGKEAAP